MLIDCLQMYVRPGSCGGFGHIEIAGHANAAELL